MSVSAQCPETAPAKCGARRHGNDSEGGGPQVDLFAETVRTCGYAVRA